ncbi:MAG: hypothetical protein ABII64_09530 [Elusimicrobiota bacterium]
MQKTEPSAQKASDSSVDESGMPPRAGGNVLSPLQKERLRLQKFRNVIFYSGLAISFGTGLIPLFGRLYMFALGLALWGLLPYVIFRILAAQSINIPAVMGSGTFLLVADILGHIFVFFFMKPEAGAVMILFVPFWLTVFVLPIGFAAGWIYGKLTVKNDGEDNRTSVI